MKLLGQRRQGNRADQRHERGLLTVKNLTTRFPVKGGFFRRTVANVHAVEDLSFTINKGQTLALWANRVRQIHCGPLDLAAG